MTDTHSSEHLDLLHVRVDRVASRRLALVSLQGEADISTVDELAAAFGQVELQSVREIDIDVSALEFADIPSIRWLTTFVRNARGTGHPVTVQGASPTLRKVAALLGVDRDLGLA